MTAAEIAALNKHNAKQLAQLEPSAAGLVLSLLDEISRDGRNTYIRLKDPAPNGFTVGYDLVEGQASMVALAAKSLRFKSWDSSQLETYGG